MYLVLVMQCSATVSVMFTGKWANQGVQISGVARMLPLGRLTGRQTERFFSPTQATVYYSFQKASLLLAKGHRAPSLN